ncbi:hypothetical protein PENARI_c010G05482 [Penicillium arizonense]|uniref:Uncharacterized protein n=1 Tax=Penicillium arizonense TaxID=1835702 RepID=A0A1F5LHA9_PENAI|nr:hypothetical protein PENARI_c010G05482 [Penicillium arizonense]OGE52594.1 hypothetical protein PENARI_c010G05482 [Penicillium arizonense]
MDYKPPRVSNRSLTPYTEGQNGHTWQAGIVLLDTLSRGIHRLTNLFHGGNESGENFSRVVGQFIHGDRGNANQISQPSVDRSLPDSVATSLASSRDSKSPQSGMKAETQGLPPLEGKKREAESSTLSRKLATQEMQQKRLPSVTAISTTMINDTIQYLQAVSDHISVSDTISSKEWAKIHLATQLLLSRLNQKTSAGGVLLRMRSGYMIEKLLVLLSYRKNKRSRTE